MSVMVVRKLITTGDRAMAAFMLQQCVELCLRGLITALLGSCPKTHCFNDLKRHLKRCTPELLYLLSADADEEQWLLHLLEKAYLDGRYSKSLIVSEHDISLLQGGAEQLLGRVKEVFEGKMKAISKNEQGFTIAQSCV